ncbi:SigB/SigF/SigG family RNA polymerase sigma factor [Streptomyces sp. NPDC001985]|uniref:SigB/SigF/SigG family RNA polymerase sigma factor n=1 Tax=Streptomyces sp. NPDC001985 TaxID=3154406 RepID=UPI003325A663
MLPEAAGGRGRVGAAEARALTAALFRRLAGLAEGTAEHALVRNTLVELNLRLVRFAARRFGGRPEPMEDIVQAGTVGLIKAVNRFDPALGVDFAGFALPTVTGEIKRFFRDTGWAVHVPRRLQELRIELARATEALEQERGHRPGTAELAERLRLPEAEVTEGERAANAHAARSLDAPLREEEITGPLARRLGAEEGAYDTVECLVSLKPLIAALGERDRLLLSLRFGQELTQSEIGARLGVSQMQVSRLLARVLTRLREGLLYDPPGAARLPAGSREG